MLRNRCSVFHSPAIHSSVSALCDEVVCDDVRFRGFKNPGVSGSPVRAHTCSAIAAATVTDACRMSWQYRAFCGLSEISLLQELAHSAKDRRVFCKHHYDTRNTQYSEVQKGQFFVLAVLLYYYCRTPHSTYFLLLAAHCLN